MIDVTAIMSTELVTISPDDNLQTARELMHDRRIHHLLVVKSDGKLAGLITLTDLLAATDSRLRQEDDRIRPEEITAGAVMNTEVITIDEHAGIREAALFLEKHRIGCLPVVTDGKLQGIITDTDFVGVAINLLEQMEASDFEDFDEEEPVLNEEEI